VATIGARDGRQKRGGSGCLEQDDSGVEGRVHLSGAAETAAGKMDPDTHLDDSSAVVTVSSSSFQETMNLSTPSVSSSSVTSAYEIP
jgi:hypothetical protein